MNEGTAEAAANSLSTRRTLIRTKPASPSALGLLELCPLAYLMQTEGMPRKTIGQHPAALLGTAVHAVTSSMIATGIPTPQDVIDTVKKEFLKLAGDPARSSPFARWMLQRYGIEGFVTRRQLVERSAYVIGLASRLPHIPASRRATRAFDGKVPTGSERWLESEKSGAAGKVDLILRTPQGGLKIIDFKTGKIYEEDGQIKRAYILQMAGYARMAEDLEPAANLELELIGKTETWCSPFNQELRSMVDSVIASLRLKLPLGREIHDEQTAVLGEHCARCSSRPSCRVYGTELSRRTLANRDTWNGGSLDVAGQVAEIRVEAGLATLLFEDAGAARARIVGIPEAIVEEANLGVGREFHAYSLGTSEANRDGRFPRNFFVVDTALPGRSAFQATFAATERAST
ncbi:RecB family exonuclease [Alicycliphilus denitrificans]|uniref:RecB family exonuclease n=1 Tax=Alicycliphilus denitrificans TaxID=179636 RepID=UPI00384F3FE0